MVYRQPCQWPQLAPPVTVEVKLEHEPTVISRPHFPRVLDSNQRRVVLIISNGDENKTPVWIRFNGQRAQNGILLAWGVTHIFTWPHVPQGELYFVPSGDDTVETKISVQEGLMS
jgi:hypothetical protein